MLRLIANLSAAAVLVVVLIAFIRARRSRHHHDISVAEIHPDLAAGEELVNDALDEQQRLESDSSGHHGRVIVERQTKRPQEQ
jgi:hypothetical protein